MSERKRKGFVFYTDYSVHLSQLSLEECGQLIRDLVEYDSNGVIPDYKDNRALNICFSIIKSRIDADSQKYEEQCKKNAENGRKGAEKRAENRNQEKEDSP